MFTLLYDRKHRVLLTRFSGTLSSEDLSALAESARAFTNREGLVRGLFDFSDVQVVDIPTHVLVNHAQQPAVLAGQDRVYVMPRPDLYGLGRMYGTYQRHFGDREPLVAHTLAEAYTALGIAAPDFQPIPDSGTDG